MDIINVLNVIVNLEQNQNYKNIKMMFIMELKHLNAYVEKNFILNIH